MNISNKDFEKACKEVKNYTIDELVKKFTVAINKSAYKNQSNDHLHICLILEEVAEKLKEQKND